MGTISEKLTYLNTTKQNIKQAINNLGGDITNETTFRNYANVLNDIYSNLPKVSDTETNVSLSPTLKGRLGIVPRGNTYQESTTGKNLFDNKLFGNFTQNIQYVTLSLKPNTSYTMSSNLPTYDNNYCNLFFMLPNDSPNSTINGLTPSVSRTFTTGTDGQLLVGYRDGNSSLTDEAIKYWYMLNEGSTALPYEPYTNGASPNPDYPQEIRSATGTQKVVVSGKNLFSGDSSINFTKVTTIHLDKPLPAGTYTCSAIITSSDTDDTTNLIQFRSDAGGTQNRGVILGRNTRNSATTTITFEANYIALYSATSYAKSDGDTATITDMQIEEGSTATPYQPYIEPQEVDIELSSRNLLNYGTKSFTTFYQESGLNIPAGTYTFSAKVTSSDTSNTKSRVYFYDINGTSNGFVDLDRNARDNVTITLTTTIVRITLYSSIDYASSNSKTATYEDIQLEEGTTATDYVPYYNYSLNKIGDYEDYIGGTPDNWVLYKNIGKVVLNGSEDSWYEVTGSAPYRLTLPNNGLLCTSNSTPPQIYNTHFQKVSYNSTWANYDNMVSASTSYKNYLWFRYTGVNSMANWKSWLSTHSVEVLYVLETETTETITDTNLISQLNELYYLQSYNDTTNIDVTGNLPMRITASAIKGE